MKQESSATPQPTPKPDGKPDCAPVSLLAGQRRKGMTGVWVATSEGRDADGNKVVFARPENSRAESDFGIAEWCSMPIAS